MKMTPRISLVTLGVSDLAASTAFYRALGLEPEIVMDEVVFFQMNPGLRFGLYSLANLARESHLEAGDPTRITFSLAHNLGSKSEVDAFYAHAVSVGARAVAPPTEQVWGGYSGYFQDPDGYAWEIAWNPHWEL
jgi:uncharacterized protein